MLWIPSFSGGLVARFDPTTRRFETWELPTEPRGSDVPYALNVERKTDTVWICGANSDSLIRFDPQREHFTSYPLPTRVTYTREVDFDAQGRPWTSNSNAPNRPGVESVSLSAHEHPPARQLGAGPGL